MKVTVTAHQWEHGWELHLNDDPITQVSTLDKAEQQVRDYFDTIDPNTDHTGWEIVIKPNIGSLSTRVQQARAATKAAAEAQEAAARSAREVARELRAAGFSVTDSAAILGVSRGRVSQLVSA